MPSIFSYVVYGREFRFHYEENSVPELRRIVYRGDRLAYYWMDNDGNVYSTKKPGILKKMSINYSNEYPSIGIRYKDKTTTINVHRLVCETFHEMPLPKILTVREWSSINVSIRNKLLDYVQHADRYQVNHIDHNKQNFHPSNLEWVTVSENQQKYQEHRKRAA